MVEGLTSMAYAFYGCYKIKKSPTIPSTVTLMNGCFSMCTSLEDPPVSLPSGLVDMDRCFYNTKITESPEIPNTVTDMELCFYSCDNLGSAPKIPASVKNLKSCFKYCESLGGYLLFEANPDSYDDMFYGTTEEIRLVTPANASNYNKAVLIASKYVNVQVDSNFSLFPPPVITEFTCKRVGSKGLDVERRQGDWVYYRVRFKNFTEFLPGDLQVPTPPIPEVRMYADGKLVYNDWINKETDPNAVSDDSEVEDTGAGGWDQFTAGGGSGDKPNYYEQEIVGWIKFLDSQAAHNIGFLIEGYYNKVSDLIYKTVTSTFKVLDIAAPSLNENDEYDVYSKDTFAMGIGTLASRQGQLSIGVPTTFEHSGDDDPAVSVLGKMKVNKDFIIGNGSSATFRANTPSRPDGIFMQVGGSKKSAGDQYGTALRIGAGGLTLIGGGEYAYSRYDLGDLDDGSENLYLGSDNDIYFETNANTIGNRTSSWINTSGNFVFQSPAVRGSSPTSNTYRTTEFVDSVNKRLALVENGVLTTANGDWNRLHLYVLGHHTTSDQYGGIIIRKKKGVTNSATLTYDANYGYFENSIVIKDDVLDRIGSNPSNSPQYANRYIWFRDTQDAVMGIIRSYRTTDGKMHMYLGPYTRNTAGTADVSNIINLGVGRDGSVDVTLSASAAAAWKTALSLTKSDVGLGNVENKSAATILAGNAASATKLQTARSLYVALGTVYNSSSPVTFDGSAAKALPVSGTLGLDHGGTGKTTKEEAWEALGGRNLGTKNTLSLGRSTFSGVTTSANAATVGVAQSKAIPVPYSVPDGKTTTGLYGVYTNKAGKLNVEHFDNDSVRVGNSTLNDITGATCTIKWIAINSPLS